MEQIRKNPTYTETTPRGRANGYSSVTSGSMYIGYAGSFGYVTSRCRFNLSSLPRISDIMLKLYRNDGGTGSASVVLTMLPTAEADARTFVGEHRQTVTLSGGNGWKTVTLSGELLTAIAECSMAFYLFMNASGYCTVYGGTNNSKGPYMNVSYSVNEPSTVDTDADSYALGDTMTITLDKDAETNEHNLRWECEGQSGLIGYTDEEEAEWTVPAAWKTTVLSGAASAPLRIVCETYDAGGEMIGTRDKTVTVTLPASEAPTVGAPVLTDENEDAAALEGGFIAGFSEITGAGIVTAAQGQHAVSGTWSLGNLSGALTVAGSGYTFAAPVINEAGSLTLTVTIKDSRGMTGTYQTSLTVSAYRAPSFRWLTCIRCDSAGQSKPGTGTYALISGQASAAAIGSNRVGLKIEHQISGAWVVDLDAFGEDASEAVTRIIGGGLIQTEESCQVRVSVYDDLSAPAVKEQRIIPKGIIPMHIREDGLGVGFGGMAEDAGFHVYMDPDFHGHKLGLPDGGTGVGSVNELKMLLGIAGGTVLEDTATKNVPSGTATTGAGVTLDAAGVWLIWLKASYASNNNGRRVMYAADGDGNAIADSAVNTNPTTGTTTHLMGVCIHTAQEAGIVQVVVNQTSGSALSADTYIRAFRIG